ncbi:hypothetical protein ACFFRR_002696 [Megaselia abdita]
METVAGPSGEHKRNRNNSLQQKQQQNRKNFQHKKRPATKTYQRENDVYITSKTHFKAQLKQCENLLNSGIKDIYLHCLGNSITRGINLALTLVSNSGGALFYEANTSTIELIDEFHPLSDDGDLSIQKRMNSALHIKISRAGDFIID